MDVTISIPTDPALAVLQAQLSTLTERVRVLSLPPDSPAFTAAVEKWKQNMLTYGAQVAAVLADPNQLLNVKQEAVYYDGCWVFLQIEDYTADHSWHVAAENAHTAYRSYLDANQEKAAGYNIFPHGLHLIGDDKIMDIMAQGSAFATSYPLEWTLSANASREVAYNVMAKVMAKANGAEVWGLDGQALQMFGHVAQWTLILNGQAVPDIFVDGSNTTPTYCRPFMAALTSYGMIEWAGTDAGRLKQVTDTLTTFWSLVWSKCFLPQAQIPNIGPCDTMMYTNMESADNTGGQQPSPDLNLLIAPVLAWLYAQTKDVSWRDKHDLLFIGGVTGAYLGNGKQFSQNYQRSFQGLTWRAT